ncbi:MAG TPA: hypothetical protein VII72_16700 [Myxococcota bacterium]
MAAACLLAAQAQARGADGKFEKRTSSHFVLYQDVAIDESSGLRGSRRFEQMVLAELESAHDRLRAQLGLEPPRAIEVVIYDPAIFDREFAGLFRFSAAGFYAGVIRVRGDTVLGNALSRVLHHELVHAALDAAMPSAVLPAWLNEGLAEWFEARAAGKRHLSDRELAVLVHYRRQGSLFSLAQLSAPSFVGFGPEAAQLAYLESYGMLAYLARVSGERALRDFVEELVRTRNLPRAVQRAFRADLAELEAGFQAELG